eukprot:scaffold232_cov67-Phaeocystis_antarctica.AAC.4
MKASSRKAKVNARWIFHGVGSSGFQASQAGLGSAGMTPAGTTAVVVAREVALQGEERGGRRRVLGRVAKVVLRRNQRQPLGLVHEGGQGGGVLVRVVEAAPVEGEGVRGEQTGAPAPKRGANCEVRSAFTGGVVRSLEACTATPAPIERPYRAMPDEQSKSSRAHSLWMPAMTPVPLRTQSAHIRSRATLRFPASSSTAPA